ncbi:major head protein [Bacillus phage BCASJ1c]|uniref:Major capsid protein n=1 Tax=Bacillus phage BCASJ1c TaxID=294382 RepID=Q5YA70_9CAUD|nr:major head protein [Bacillus phage BCASJ1c]AAU85087.1 major capsid protein [Bacillus phage BCASJ1c]
MKKQFKPFLPLNNIQFFASGTANQNKAARSYQKEFRQLLQAVFRSQAYFRDFFGGGIEALDGVQHNDTAFYVKTSDIPVVVGNEYNKDENVGFGEGTSRSTRFGPRREIIYQDTPVPYTWEWVYHEGIDKHTVNNDFQAAVADRLDLQANAKIKQFNAQHSKFISSIAEKTETLTDYSADNVLRLFNELSKYYVNIEAIGTKAAKVSPELYNAIVDHPLTTSAKSSSANIDQNGIVNFKGFAIQEIPESMLQSGDVAYTYITNIGKAFTGINTSRIIESEDFDGVALQGAGKAGEFILDDNKKAVAKVTSTPEG